MSDATNDNGTAPAAVRRNRPDPHGEAALLLVESLIHGLVARSSLSVHHAVEVVQTAIDVQAEAGADRHDDPADALLSQRLLTAIADSLRIDDGPNDGAFLDTGESFDGEMR